MLYFKIFVIIKIKIDEEKLFYFLFLIIERDICWLGTALSFVLMAIIIIYIYHVPCTIFDKGDTNCTSFFFFFFLGIIR